MRPMRFWAGAAVLALLAACGADEQDSSNAVTAERETSVSVVLPRGSVVANASDAAPAKPALNLAPDGLTFVLGDGGSARQLPFGTAREPAARVADAVLGAPIEQATNPECGAGSLDTAVYRGGLTLYYQDGKFVGWDLDGDGPFATANGIAIGMPRAELDKAGQVELVPESTIGPEFALGDLSGLLSNAGADGKVVNLWAGTTCIFR